MSDITGKFVILEGVDYSGKSTHIQLIKKKLEEENIINKCLFLREPGSTGIGEKIRDILLDTENTDMNFITEMFLFEASRSQLMYERIETELSKGINVFMDRFDESTRAYQVYARTIGKPQNREQLNLLFNTIRDTQKLLGLYPNIDLFILFDLETKIAMERKLNRTEKTDRLDQEDISFHEATREAYLENIGEYGSRALIVNTSKPIEYVHEEVWNHIKLVLNY